MDETATTTAICLQMEFNKEGEKKLEEISQIYVENNNKLCYTLMSRCYVHRIY